MYMYVYTFFSTLVWVRSMQRFYFFPTLTMSVMSITLFHFEALIIDSLTKIMNKSNILIKINLIEFILVLTIIAAILVFLVRVDGLTRQFNGYKK